MKFIIVTLMLLGPLAGQIDNKYEDACVRAANTFAHEYGQWVQLKNNLVAVQGRDKKEKAQWELVRARWRELETVIDSK